MRWLRAAAVALLGLFVDDGWFAGAILLWAALTALLRPWLDGAAGAVLLFAGLAAILVGFSRPPRSRPPRRR